MNRGWWAISRPSAGHPQTLLSLPLYLFVLPLTKTPIPSVSIPISLSVPMSFGIVRSATAAHPWGVDMS